MVALTSLPACSNLQLPQRVVFIMRHAWRLSQPCLRNASRLRGLPSRSNSTTKSHKHHAVLFESPAIHEAKASKLQTWVKRQRSALSQLGPELEKTQDGPGAEDLEVSNATE